MAAGKLRAVVCTSTLDLGIDWGDVDLVVNIGAPKGASRLAQRIGRANHRLDEPSKALLVPANLFEVHGVPRRRSTPTISARRIRRRSSPARSTCWRSMSWAWRAAFPFDADALYRRSARPPIPIAPSTGRRSTRSSISSPPAATRCAPTSGSPRSGRGKDGRWRVANPRIAQQYRLNVGTIIEAPLLNVRVSRNRGAGFAGAPAARSARSRKASSRRSPPATRSSSPARFFASRASTRTRSIATRTADDTPKIPIYAGGKFPITTLSGRRRAPAAGRRPALEEASRAGVVVAEDPEGAARCIPKRGDLLVETFPRGSRFYMVCYPFEGRLAHQTLGMLLTRRLERARLRPLGFVATDYSLAIWALGDLGRAFAAGHPSLATCLPRTCWATTSRHGWARVTCSSACSAMSR